MHWMSPMLAMYALYTRCIYLNILSYISIIYSYSGTYFNLITWSPLTTQTSETTHHCPDHQRNTMVTRWEWLPHHQPTPSLVHLNEWNHASPLSYMQKPPGWYFSEPTRTSPFHPKCQFNPSTSHNLIKLVLATCPWDNAFQHYGIYSGPWYRRYG